MELKRETFEPNTNRTIEMNDLEDSVILSFMAPGKADKRWSPCKIETCLGDIYKIVNMLYDYARLLELGIEQWDLQGFHKATYEIHAEKCRKIAKKYSDAIGYDYEKAVEKCRKKASRPKREDDIGEDALVLAQRKGSVRRKGKPKPEAEGKNSKQERSGTGKNSN